jgi:hypothetical protein
MESPRELGISPRRGVFAGPDHVIGGIQEF